jgi:uncharacterized LabA/DUF88 family protein
MSTVFNAQRIAILVDTSNMYRASKNKFQARLDYKQLLRFVTKGRALIRAIAFVEKSEDIDLNPFIDALKSSGFETRVRTARRHADGKVIYGSWDVGMALHAVQLIPKVDCIAIVSGNGKIVDILDFLSQQGVRSEIYGIDGYVASDLMYQADESFMLSDDCILRS